MLARFLDRILLIFAGARIVRPPQGETRPNGGPTPYWWPYGKCCCEPCQARAGVVHTCGAEACWQDCRCPQPDGWPGRECDG